MATKKTAAKKTTKRTKPTADDFFKTTKGPKQAGTGKDAPEEVEVINLDDVGDIKGFKPIPNGIYPAFLHEANYTMSKNDNPMVSWTFKLSDGDYKGRIFFLHTVLNNEFGLARLKQTVKALSGDSVTKFKPNETPQELVGNPCRLRIGTTTYENERANAVKEVLPQKAGEKLV